MLVFRTRDEKVMLPEFLHLLLWQRDFFDYGMSTFTGTGRPRGDRKQLLSYHVVIPDVAEQQEIVSTFNLLSAKIDSLEEQIASIGRDIEQRFWEMFGSGDAYPNVQLSSVSDIAAGLTKNQTRKSLPLQLPYLRVANVHANRLDLDEVKRIGVTPEEAKRLELCKDDLLFVEGNGSRDEIGRVALWNGSIQHCVHQNHIIRVRFGKEVVPAFACHFFQTESGRRQVQAMAVTTSGLYSLSMGKIRTLRMPLPPRSLQQKFADFATRGDEEQARLQERAHEASRERDSLLDRYLA